jgi:hypothetical protein
MPAITLLLTLAWLAGGIAAALDGNGGLALVLGFASGEQWREFWGMLP